MGKLLFIFVLVFLLVVTSCKKDEEPPAVDINVENLAGTYLVSKIGVKVGKGGEEDVTRFLLHQCERDDRLTLDPTLTVTYVDAGTACDSVMNADAKWSLSGKGKWALTGKDTMMIDDTLSYTIRRFDGTNLELNHTEVVKNVSANYTQYYVKQQ